MNRKLYSRRRVLSIKSKTIDSIRIQQKKNIVMTEHHLMHHKKILDNDSTNELEGEEKTLIDKFKRSVFYPLNKSILESGANIKELSQFIIDWAISHDVDHYSFLSFPYNSAICQKQQSFLNIKYVYEGALKAIPKLQLNPQFLIKGQADGSSFPSGGMRHTHQARAYNVWDQQSEIFIRRKNKVMYIPSLLVTHQGDALDDKTIFRKCEAVMKESAKKMLHTLDIKTKQVFINLGLEQEYFVIPKKAFLLRPDLINTGRTLIGQVGAKNQQFSDHYYGKMPCKIQQIMAEVQAELLDIGIPFKTKHNQVANNQFEFTAIYEEAGKSIDHNLITMEILKETFDKHGYTVLLHEKPFQQLNGSGKHANWSFNLVGEDGQIRNMFAVPSDPKDYQLFKLFMLLNLMAIKRNNTLYLASVAPPGNQIRLGGHEAPPRIISAYLGASISAIIDGKPIPVKMNLRDKIFNLSEDVYQQDTERNRTSSYAFTTNKFQFRALGSSQNPAFPMAVISATLAKQFKIATGKLEKGYSLDQLIEQLRSETLGVRYEGNGYAKQWAIEAKKRGLYVNEQFIEILQKMRAQCNVFLEIGACNSSEIDAKCEVMKENYIKTVQCQIKTLMQMAYKQIIPRGYAYLNILNHSHSSEEGILHFSAKFTDIFHLSLEALNNLELLSRKCNTLRQGYHLRKQLNQCGLLLTQVTSLLEKDDRFPDISDFLLM